MSKLIADNRHPEWDVAMIALVSAIDIPDRLYMTIQDLIGPGLGRVFLRAWLLQDTIDPEIIYDPYDLAVGAIDPIWHRIDGNPGCGGTPAENLRRKWRCRAQLWCSFHGPHIWHVTDWLIASRETNQPWLRNINQLGEPKKLLKCTTLDRLVHEADKGLRHRKSVGEIVLGHDDETIIADLGVGHTLVELLTARALRHEGNRMRHCVGQGSYDGHMADPDYRLLSVRDPEGRPLATLEVRGDDVRQFRGARNADPPPAIADLVSATADAWGWQGLAEAAAGRYWPYGRDALRVLEGLDTSQSLPFAR